MSLKVLGGKLPEDILEALSEKYGGLGNFLRERQQLFLVKPRPEDQVLFVAANPIAVQKYASREVQRKTMRAMIGLDDLIAAKENSSGGGGGRRGYGNGGGGGGGGFRNRR